MMVMTWGCVVLAGLRKYSASIDCWGVKYLLPRRYLLVSETTQRKIEEVMLVKQTPLLIYAAAGQMIP